MVPCHMVPHTLHAYPASLLSWATLLCTLQAHLTVLSADPETRSRPLLLAATLRTLPVFSEWPLPAPRLTPCGGAAC